MAVAKNFDGEILLSCLWNQSGVIPCGDNTTIEYNAYAPLDLLITGQQSYTGCVNTATGQIIYHFLENGWLDDFNLSLTARDTYVSLGESPRRAIVITQDGGGAAGTVSFEEINEKLTFVPEPDKTDPNYTLNSQKAADFIAALNFACGVINRSSYSYVTGTGAWSPLPSFKRCGFKSAMGIGDSSYDERLRWFNYTEQNGETKRTLTDETFEIFIENLLDGRPVYLAIPGHAIVLDGYDSANDTFHINYGWGDENSGSGGSEAEGTAANTRWYTREEINGLNLQEFYSELRGSYIETFTVNDERFYGTGTFLRALEQANAMQGRNVIEFAEGVTAEKPIELTYAYKMQDEILIRDCNLKVCGVLPGIDPEEGNENQAPVQKVNFLFAGDYNSSIHFENFNGSAVIQTLEAGSAAIFEFSDTVRTDLYFNGSNLYSGKYIEGDMENSDIFQAFEDGNTDALSDREKSFTIAGSIGDDTIKFDGKSVAIGNIDLNSGYNTLILTGGSQIFGDIEGRGTNNIFIDSTANLTGALKNEAKLYFELSEINNNALFTITGLADDTFGQIAALTIDATQAGAGDHVLFSWDSLENFNFDDLKLEFIGNGNVSLNENNLVFTVGGASTAPALPEDWELSATTEGNAVNLKWDGLTDVAGYVYRYANDTEALSGEGTITETNSADLLLNNGTWYVQVRAFDNDGAYSDWSVAKEIVVNNTVTETEAYLANGMLENLTVDSDFTVLAGGVLNGETTVSAGNLSLEKGSVTTGSLSIEENGSVEVTGAAFIFDISPFDAETSPILIDNYAAIDGTFQFAISVSESQASGTYVLADKVEKWDYSLKINVVAEDLILGSFTDNVTEFIYGDKAYSLVFSEEEKQLHLVVNDPYSTEPAENGSTKLRWDAPNGASGYIVEIATDDTFSETLQIITQQNELNIITPVSDSYDWRVKTVGYDEEFTPGGVIQAADERPEGSQLYKAEDTNKKTNLFIAESSGVWGKGYVARHVNSEDFQVQVDDILLEGMNRYQDIFQGGGDYVQGGDILLLSDDSNGDAFFFEDIYSAFPDEESRCRFANITEIYAGAGNDIIDMTSTKYAPDNDNVIIHGGDGDDTIWTNSSSFLLGDAGNDSIIGSRNTDYISGGIGDDILHGGGGKDYFLYGTPDTWGNDTIYQLDGGTVNLAFMGDQNFLNDNNIEYNYYEEEQVATFTHENGSIIIFGVPEEAIKRTTFRDVEEFDRAYVAGCFDDISSDTIFSNKDKGTLA